MRFFTPRVAPKGGQAPHLYVIPEDAARLIAADKVDARLFDVTLLLEFEYDDAHRDNVPVIVSYTAGAAPLAARAQSLPGVASGSRLDSIDGAAFSSPFARAM